MVGDEEVLFQMKNNPPPFLQNSDAFQSFGRFDLEKYLDAVLNPGQIDWKPIEDFMQNVYLPLINYNNMSQMQPLSLQMMFLKITKKDF